MNGGEIIVAVGDSIGIAKTAWDIIQWWRNRGRIEINGIRFQYYLVSRSHGDTGTSSHVARQS